MTTLEDKINSLVAATAEDQGDKWAQQWKQKGGKVAGILSPYVPVEVVWAAGLLPWRIGGDRKGIINLASDYRPVRSCPKDSLILERVLNGELDFIDVVVATDWDQNLIRLCDTWLSLGKSTVFKILFMPKTVSTSNNAKFAEEIVRLKKALEDVTGETITDTALRQSVALYNRIRRAVHRLYELRKLDNPPFSGAEVLGITLAGLAMPPDRFLKELERLLVNLDGRMPALKSFEPRLLMSSDWLDDPRFLKFVEDMGCIVAMDDLDTGSRFFWGEVGEPKSDPVAALSRHYLNRPPCPRMVEWPPQVEQLAAWAKEFRIDGILELSLVNSPPRAYRTPYLRSAMADRRIPFVSVEREYCFSSVGQLGNRIEPFIEMLRQRKGG